MSNTPSPWTQMGDEIYGADGTRIAEAVSMRDVRLITSAPELAKTLQHIADIAHFGGMFGGMAGLSESEALSAVRRLTLRIFNPRGTLEDQAKRVGDALRASLP